MDPTNTNTALASAFVEELARCGVRHAVLSPGSRSTPLALALHRQPAIDLTVLVDERSAGFFGLGAAQATQTPVAILCTSGTAAANLHPAVCEADEAAVPLLVLTADRPPELRDIGAGQTIDQLKLYGSAVRWFCEVGTHEADDAGLLHYRSVACRAFATARGEPRPGPVHLNLAWREPLAPIPAGGQVTATGSLALEGRGQRPLTAVSAAPPAADPALIDELAERLDSASRPLILAGRHPAGVEHAGALAKLAAAAGAPILAEPTSQLRLGPHDRSHVVAGYDTIARATPTGLEPDLVLRVGELPTSKALRLWLSTVDGLRQVVVDPTAGWNDPTRTAETLLRAAVGPLVAELAQRLDDRDTAWTERWLAADRAVAESFERELRDATELSEPLAATALAAALEDGDFIYTASSMPIRDQEAFVPAAATAARFLCNRGANGIDGLVSSAAGAAAASGARTWLLLGDLALFHDINGLATVRDLGGALRVVVLDNGGGGIFHFLPQADSMEAAEFEALLGTPSGLEIARAAALYGLGHRRVIDPADLTAALAGEETVVEIPVDRRANVGIHRRLIDRALAALPQSSVGEQR